MPRLILLRHATAERARTGESDHDRALTKGGRKEAKAAGRVIAERGEAVDLVLSSSSKRTRETWDGAAPALGGDPEVKFLRAIYEAGEYISVLRSEGRAAATLLLIGHNPAIQSTAIELAESLSGRDGEALKAGFEKGALAILDIAGEWSGLRPGRAKLLAYIEPEQG